MQMRWVMMQNPQCAKQKLGNMHEDAKPFEKCAQMQKRQSISGTRTQLWHCEYTSIYI